MPLAICCPAPDKLKEPPQAPALPPVTPPHATRTADLGTVPQLVKEAAAADTCNVQVLAAEPPLVVQLTVAAELPATLPKSGSVAVKLMVPGLAVIALSDVAIGKIRLAAGTTTFGFCSADSTGAELASITSAPISWDERFMWR